jgi:hypothetical protein
MRTPLFHLQDLLRAFQRKKVLNKKELLEVTGCSTMTAWRLLHRHGYFTSYNDNARHYTLADIPEFDERGLWAYRHARFSKWGSLTQTIVKLVQGSSSGLTAQQLQQWLHVRNVKPILCRLIQRKSFTRERIGGRFVYFSSQQKTRAKQHQQRKTEMERVTAERSLPPLDQIIALLVEIIRRPRNTPRQWARRLIQRGIRIGTGDIQAVLTHYGIDPKKGLSKS